MLQYKHIRWPSSYLGCFCLLFPILSKIFLRFQTKIETMVDLTQLMENEVFMAFASYTTIVLSKMMFMSTATAFYRLTRKVRHWRQYFLLRVENLESNFLKLFFVKPSGILSNTANEICSHLVQVVLLYLWNGCLFLETRKSFFYCSFYLLSCHLAYEISGVSKFSRKLFAILELILPTRV